MKRYTIEQRIVNGQNGDKKWQQWIINFRRKSSSVDSSIKQNCRIWANDNPRMIIEKPMYPQRETVWCGLWAGGIIGSCFFQNEAGQAVTVNGVRYREMITNFLWPELEDIHVNDMWFQQDGATCHTANETMALLRNKFNVISRGGDVNWPPKSCALQARGVTFSEAEAHNLKLKK